jgi:cytochrome c-type biogenesis protein CcmE
VYSKGVDDLVRDKDKFADRAVRVEGTLVKGSLVRRDQPCEYRFTIEKNKVALPVHYSQCVVPDTFRDMPGMDVSVTAEGKLASGYFEASTIMAKCPSKYEMKDRARNGEQAPHAAMTQAL